MDADWKLTYTQNFWEDFHQTVHFARNGIQELNPIFAKMVKRKDYTLLAAGWVTEYLLADAWAGENKRKWRDLAVWRLVVVGLNARKHGVGIPVVTVRF